MNKLEKELEYAKKLAKEAEEYGAIISEDNVKANKEFSKQLRSLNKMFQSVVMSVGNKLIPLFSDLVIKVKDFMSFIMSTEGQKVVEEAAKETVKDAAKAAAKTAGGAAADALKSAAAKKASDEALRKATQDMMENWLREQGMRNIRSGTKLLT